MLGQLQTKSFQNRARSINKKRQRDRERGGGSRSRIYFLSSDLTVARGGSESSTEQKEDDEVKHSSRVYIHTGGETNAKNEWKMC